MTTAPLLDGILVVDMCQFLSGPYASLRLMDLGARVINPCITTDSEVVLRAGVPLTLRYRVIALDGAFDGERMRELASEWTQR